MSLSIKQKVSRALTKQGRKRQWLADQMKLSREQLWKKLARKNGQALTPDEKNQLGIILQVVL